jgi:hypothetical protein
MIYIKYIIKIKYRIFVNRYLPSISDITMSKDIKNCSSCVAENLVRVLVFNILDSCYAVNSFDSATIYFRSFN